MRDRAVGAVEGLQPRAEVFDDHGLTPYIFHTQEPGPYPSYSVVAKDWNELRAMNAAGTAKDLGWATKFR